jgi:hypothetical protein
MVACAIAPPLSSSMALPDRIPIRYKPDYRSWCIGHYDDGQFLGSVVAGLGWVAGLWRAASGQQPARRAGATAEYVTVLRATIWDRRPHREAEFRGYSSRRP